MPGTFLGIEESAVNKREGFCFSGSYIVKGREGGRREMGEEEGRGEGEMREEDRIMSKGLNKIKS